MMFIQIHTLYTAVACSHNARQCERNRERLIERFRKWHMMRHRLNLGLNGSLDLDLGLRLGLGRDRLGGALDQLPIDG